MVLFAFRIITDTERPRVGSLDDAVIGFPIKNLVFRCNPTVPLQARCVIVP
jgi:hypothetical protein